MVEKFGERYYWAVRITMIIVTQKKHFFNFFLFLFAPPKKEGKKGALPEEFFRYAQNRLQNSASAFGSLNLGAFVRLFCVQGESYQKVILFNFQEFEI